MVNSGVDLFAVGKVPGHAKVVSTTAAATSTTTCSWRLQRRVRRNTCRDYPSRAARWLRRVRGAKDLAFFAVPVRAPETPAPMAILKTREVC